MEQRLAAPRDGVVSTIHAGAGEQVTIRAPLVTLESLT
jgi:biotin carboxyl carrier protein